VPLVFAVFFGDQLISFALPVSVSLSTVTV